MNTIYFVSRMNRNLTFNSKDAIPIPEAAPDPANPIKCPDPMLLAKRDAPTQVKIIYQIWVFIGVSNSNVFIVLNIDTLKH